MTAPSLKTSTSMKARSLDPSQNIRQSNVSHRHINEFIDRIIPQSFGNLTELQEIQLIFNQIFGKIHIHLGNCRKIIHWTQQQSNRWRNSFWIRQFIKPDTIIYLATQMSLFWNPIVQFKPYLFYVWYECMPPVNPRQNSLQLKIELDIWSQIEC